MEKNIGLGALGQLVAKADQIHVDSGGLVTYLGFAEKHCSGTGHAKWAICKITQSSATTPYDLSIKWANGQQQRNLVFDDRENYTYYYPKF